MNGGRREALPERLATATLAARMADLDSAVRVIAEPARFTMVSDSSWRVFVPGVRG